MHLVLLLINVFMLNAGCFFVNLFKLFLLFAAFLCVHIAAVAFSVANLLSIFKLFSVKGKFIIFVATFESLGIGVVSNFFSSWSFFVGDDVYEIEFVSVQGLGQTFVSVQTQSDNVGLKLI